MPGGLGTAPLWDMVLHVVHGPQIRNVQTSIAADGRSAEILSSQTVFRSPFASRDRVSEGERRGGFLQSPVTTQPRKITIKAGDDPVFHDGRLWSLKPGENSLVSERAPTKMRLKAALKSPSTLGRLAGAAALGVAVDTAAIFGMTHYETNKQKKKDDAKYAALQAQMANQQQMTTPTSIPQGYLQAQPYDGGDLMQVA